MVIILISQFPVLRLWKNHWHQFTEVYQEWDRNDIAIGIRIGILYSGIIIGIFHENIASDDSFTQAGQSNIQDSFFSDNHRTKWGIFPARLKRCDKRLISNTQNMVVNF